MLWIPWLYIEFEHYIAAEGFSCPFTEKYHPLRMKNLSKYPTTNNAATMAKPTCKAKRFWGNQRLLLQTLLLLLALPFAGHTLAESPPLRNGDVVKVNVVDEESISGDYKISENGTFQMPYLEESVKALGKTPTQLAQIIVEMLKPDYILNPQVIVEITSKKKSSCTILGQVSASRELLFDPDQGMTLQGAIGRAGDPTQDADLNRIEITRNGRSISAPMPASKDMKILNGDSIVVPRLIPLGSYQLTGHANKKGGNFVIPRGERRTVFWAIMNGGGIADTGKVRGTKLLRGTESIEFRDEEELENAYIQSGDIIEIAKRTF